MTNGDITTGNWQLARECAATASIPAPCLPDAVLSAADSDDVRAIVSLVDDAPATRPDPHRVQGRRGTKGHACRKPPELLLHQSDTVG
ncbi:hypothetical protein ACFRFU_23345 [Streptomyces sp. NPDC056704]|uniref:hypothetical protein n=1 Tax=Streptomyces sp. NPDC056704 TaxID=3345917 RepID=UPI00369ABE0E